MIQGPNVNKLIIHKMSLLMIPPGTKEGTALAVGLNNLTKSGRIGEVAKEATWWAEAAILAVRQAAEPNPYKNVSDETIAQAILVRISEARRRRYREQGLSEPVIKALMKE